MSETVSLTLMVANLMDLNRRISRLGGYPPIFPAKEALRRWGARHSDCGGGPLTQEDRVVLGQIHEDPTVGELLADARTEEPSVSPENFLLAVVKDGENEYRFVTL
jgi:hypothetical protein